MVCFASSASGYDEFLPQAGKMEKGAALLNRRMRG
jgi:hypothetical protein